MTEFNSATRTGRDRAIYYWLLGVAALVFALVIIGGATRVTESGLSITEWKPATGVLPPSNADAWQAEFEKYQTIPQYAQRNLGMALSDFKTIYWWEWTHRLVARLIGVAFALPFVWFLWRGWIGRELAGKLAVIFGLGALQGAVGWWMVASGLADRTEVSQYRLATHLLLACLIFAALIWTAIGVGTSQASASRQRADRASGRIRFTATALLVLVFLQIYLGALVAGLRAGLIYNTWPLIDGALVPDVTRLMFETPVWRNFFENTLTVQFDHRMVAYALWLIAVWHAYDVARTLRNDAAIQSALTLVVAITIQACMGIATLLTQVPISLALLHQAIALAVLAVAVVHAATITLPSTPVRGQR